MNHGLGKELARTKLANADDLAADVSPNSQRLAIISSSLLPGKIRFLDLVNRSETDRAISLPPGATVRNIAWAVDNRSLFAVISQAGRYKLIEIKPDQSIATLWDAGDHEILSLVPSPNGRYLAFSRRTLENNVWLLDNPPSRASN